MNTFTRVLLGGLAVAALAAPAQAQLQIGPQLSVGSDSGLGVGGRLTFPLRRAAIGLHGVIDANYFTGGGEGVDSWIDSNLNLRFPLPIAEGFDLLLGGGLHFSFLSFGGDGPAEGETDTNVGFNVLSAIEIPRGFVVPFFELRAVVAGGAEQVVFTGGVVFGGAR
jgi:hypothetical protein